MTVKEIFAGGELYDLSSAESRLPEPVHQMVEYCILASQKDPFDPMEKAFKRLGDDYLARTEHIHSDWSLVQEYPLSRELLAMSRVWKSPGGEQYVIAAKGAPEAVTDLCHLDKAQRQELSLKIKSMADEGLRVLGVAKACFRGDLPSEQHDFKFHFLGLIGLEDPVRPGVAVAIRECHAAGIRVVMITGDYPGTAQAIARQIGLPSDRVITGPELAKMSDAELQDSVRDVNIFSRVVPEQKLRLVSALKAGGEVVAMTGDGVNDAPALKSADIGIAMGGRGTDVARESASLVLLDDDFSSIVKAVRQGRRIFDNIKKAMAYILAIHVPIAGMSLIPVLLQWPLVLLPVHVVFLELIIDPACSVVFEAEPEEADVMSRPPRDPRKPLFSRRTIALSLLQGLSVLIIVLAVYAVSSTAAREMEARALTFTTLIVANLGLILTNRSWSRTILETLNSPNAALWWVIGGALVFLGAVLYIPFLRDLFGFAFLHFIDLAICFMAGIASILWFEGLKLLSSRDK
jgi:Ca2+-transporting ATPase